MTSIDELDDATFVALRPRARRDVLVRRYGNDTLLWSSAHLAPIVLDPVSGVIHQLLDGQASVSEIASDVHDVVGVSEEIATAQLRRVIAQLEAAALLDDPRVQADLDVVPGLDYFPAPPNP